MVFVRAVVKIKLLARKRNRDQSLVRQRHEPGSLLEFYFNLKYAESTSPRGQMFLKAIG